MRVSAALGPPHRDRRAQGGAGPSPLGPPEAPPCWGPLTGNAAGPAPARRAYFSPLSEVLCCPSLSRPW